MPHRCNWPQSLFPSFNRSIDIHFHCRCCSCILLFPHFDPSLKRLKCVPPSSRTVSQSLPWLTRQPCRNSVPISNSQSFSIPCVQSLNRFFSCIPAFPSFIYFHSLSSNLSTCPSLLLQRLLIFPFLFHFLPFIKTLALSHSAFALSVCRLSGNESGSGGVCCGMNGTVTASVRLFASSLLTTFPSASVWSLKFPLFLQLTAVPSSLPPFLWRSDWQSSSRIPHSNSLVRSYF